MCPQTRRVFPFYMAVLMISRSRFIDPKSFHCPVCHAKIRVHPASNAVVASCTGCSWNTNECGITEVSDILAREIDPSRELSASFNAMLRSLSEPSSNTASPVFLEPHLDLKSKNIDEFMETQKRKENLLSDRHDQITSDWGGNGPCQDTSFRAFMGNITHTSVLSDQEKIVQGDWQRSKMPPFRRKIGPKVVVHSPFISAETRDDKQSRQSSLECANAARVLPRACARIVSASEFNELVLRLTNLSSTVVEIELEAVPNPFSDCLNAPVWQGPSLVQIRANDFCEISSRLTWQPVSDHSQGIWLPLLAKVRPADDVFRKKEWEKTEHSQIFWEYTVWIELPTVPKAIS